MRQTAVDSVQIDTDSGPDFSPPNRTEAGGSGGSLKQVCQDFEAIFIRQLLKTMQSTGGWEGFLEENQGEAIFTSQRNAALADEVSERGAVGIGRILYQQLQNQHQHMTKSRQVDHHG